MFSQFFASLQQDAKLFFIFPHPMRPLSGYFHQGLQPYPICGEGKDSLAHLSLRFLVGHGL